jgi:hypothetical protein
MLTPKPNRFSGSEIEALRIVTKSECLSGQRRVHSHGAGRDGLAGMARSLCVFGSGRIKASQNGFSCAMQHQRDKVDTHLAFMRLPCRAYTRKKNDLTP